MKKDQIRVEAGGVEEDHTGKKIVLLFGIGVDHPYPGRPPFFLVINDGMHHRERPDRQVAGLLRPGQRGRHRAEIAAEWTTARAEITGLALSATLLDVDRVWLREVRPAGLHHVPVRI